VVADGAGGDSGEVASVLMFSSLKRRQPAHTSSLESDRTRSAHAPTPPSPRSTGFCDIGFCAIWDCNYTPGSDEHGPQFQPGVRGRRSGVWLRRTGRGICAYRWGSFPIAHDLCVSMYVCVP